MRARPGQRCPGQQRRSSEGSRAKPRMNSQPSEPGRARDEYLSRMNHELRTPLNAVIGFSRVLERNRAGNQRPEDIELLARIRANGERLLRVVEEFLTQAEQTPANPIVDKKG